MLPVTYLFMLPAVFGFKPPHEKSNFRLERGRVSTAALRPDVFVKQSGKADPGISKSKYVALDAHPQDKDSVYFGVRDKKLDELRAEIQDLMKEHPLIEETHSIAALKDKILLPDGDEGSLFLGTGLCTTKEMSKALPFDAVAYLVLVLRCSVLLKSA